MTRRGTHDEAEPLEGAPVRIRKLRVIHRLNPSFHKSPSFAAACHYVSVMSTIDDRKRIHVLASDEAKVAFYDSSIVIDSYLDVGRQNFGAVPSLVRSLNKRT